MSSFSSVVQKPGKKIVPKAAPRRNVQRKPVTSSIETQSEAHIDSQNGAQDADISETNQEETPTAEAEQHVLPLSRSPAVTETAAQFPVRSSTPDASPEERSSIPTPSAALDTGPQPPAPTNLPPEPASVNLDPTEEASDDPSVQGVTQDHDAQSHSLETLQAETSEESPSAPTAQPVTSPVKRSRPRRKAADVETETETSRKKRKVTPRTVSTNAPSRDVSNVLIALSAPQTRAASRRRSDLSQSPEGLLESATRRAASVSRLACNIDPLPRSLPQHAEENAADPGNTNFQVQSTPQRTSASPPPRRGRKRNRRNIQQQAAAVVANALAKSSNVNGPRGFTPDNAEEYELEPAKVKMGDLCQDSRLGKKSALETEMQANWADIVQRRKEDRERALANAEKRRRRAVGQKHQLSLAEEHVVALAPAMAVVNGVIVVDQASREIDRGAQLQQAAFQDLDNVREDKDYYKNVNQATIGMKPGHGQYTKWDEESNELFYKGLRMFGTDFLMIANMFPGLTRKQIKSKFIREENADKARIQECLRNRQPVQLEDYASMANKEVEEFQTLDSIQKELDEQEKRLREEDNERRKREGFVASTDNDTQQPVAEGNDGGAEGQIVPTGPGRFDSAVREIVEAATAPKKRQRKNTAASNKRGPKSGKRPEAGVEEVLGNIHEVAV